MRELSTFRLYVLRATYLIIFVGLATMIWPLLIHPPTSLPLMNGVVRSVLTAVSLLAALGIRYPVQMLPLLFFEFVWKVIWVLVFGLPLWTGNLLTAESQQTMQDTLFGVVLMPLVIPWPYVWERYVKARGDRWRSGNSSPNGTANYLDAD